MPGGVTGSDTLTCSSGRAPGKERGAGRGAARRGHPLHHVELGFSTQDVH